MRLQRMGKERAGKAGALRAHTQRAAACGERRLRLPPLLFLAPSPRTSGLGGLPGQAAAPGWCVPMRC